ncbi:hypothetical protein B5P44_01625 [Mycobacterium sp. CBMA 213]|uniref:Uncharacterized protein n=1 Tax=Mycolicibacterium sp. CBMA 213 TaxID=1968788 RepID=A0A343VRU2_9MYCO|nr:MULTISPECIES: hypothetical protein [unclassified Mycolicibacterium]AVN58616.1 hypothetical protein B5P44_p00354 [Mycolicibacterium sp. CBMA 213]MUL61253.1 hypothetical protein [Mycolicibacterium sp. CBMA 335]MUM03490.1 hypothetical protein [Mycolicibacterium sp. CBMA 213]
MTAAVDESVREEVRAVADLVGTQGFPSGAAMATVIGSGGPATGWLVLEPVVGRERRCALVTLGGDVAVVGLVSEVMVCGTPVPAPYPLPRWGAELARLEWALQTARLEADRSATALTTETERWDRLIEDAASEATSRGYCREFDAIMEALGLPGRERDFYVEGTITLNVRARVTARNTEDAKDRIGDSELIEVVEDMTASEMMNALSTWDVSDVEEAD